MSQFEIHKQNELRKREIEVKALVALAAYGSTPQKFNALKHLEYIAYPEELAKDINQETLTLSGNMLEINLNDDL